jgi:hypothetical protein
MKTLLFTMLIIVLPAGLFSQSQTDPKEWSLGNNGHKFRDASISISPDILFNAPNGTQFAGGLKLRMFFSKRVSFDADLVIGRGYTHFGLGLIGLPVWYIVSKPSGNTFHNQSLSDFLATAAVMVLSLEHTAYHIPVTKDFEISPYVSVLRFKSLNDNEPNNDPDGKEFQPAFAAGLEVNKYFKKFVLSPYAEYNIGYNDHIPGFYTGIYCGIYLPGKQ